jgi:hypothetical protein
MLEGSALNFGQARIDEASPSMVLSRFCAGLKNESGAGHTYATADSEQ